MMLHPMSPDPLLSLMLPALWGCSWLVDWLQPLRFAKQGTDNAFERSGSLNATRVLEIDILLQPFASVEGKSTRHILSSDAKHHTNAPHLCTDSGELRSLCFLGRSHGLLSALNVALDVR